MGTRTLTISDLAEIKEYFELDDILIDQMVKPRLDLMIHTNEGENIVQYVSYILYEEGDNPSNQPETEDDIHGFFEFLVGGELPKFEHVLVDYNDIRFFGNNVKGGEGQIYMRRNYAFYV